MSQHDDPHTAVLIQSYLRSKLRDGGDRDPGAGLDDTLRDRLDDLGMDGERLLNVPSDRVMGELSRLEREAAAEDAAAAKAAAQAQQGQERKVDEEADDARRGNRNRRGQPDKAAGRRGRGQRRQR